MDNRSLGYRAPLLWLAVPAMAGLAAGSALGLQGSLGPLLVAAPAAGQTLETVSPDGTNRIVVALDRQGTPNYLVQRRGEMVLAPSPIALDLDRDMLG